MTTPNQVVGKFTAENIVAVFRAVPESNGTYADVARVAEDYDGGVHPRTIRNWVQTGNADVRNGNNATAYARFAIIYADWLKEHGGAEGDRDRDRELDRALEIIARTCQCGKPKMLLEDGTLAERCRACQEIDATSRRGRRRTASTQDGIAGQQHQIGNGA